MSNMSDPHWVAHLKKKKKKATLNVNKAWHNITSSSLYLYTVNIKTI